MANLSWNHHDVLDGWKITMIEKKSEDKHDPTNYRPISQLQNQYNIEKLIKVRLSNFLENNNILT